MSRVPYEHGSGADVAVGVAETEGEGCSVGDTCHGRSGNNKTSRLLHFTNRPVTQGGVGPGPLSPARAPFKVSTSLVTTPGASSTSRSAEFSLARNLGSS